jgi:hypothetical protein
MQPCGLAVPVPALCDTVRLESGCAVRAIKLNGFRRLWTSLPTPFISAQRLSERTVYAVELFEMNEGTHTNGIV